MPQHCAEPHLLLVETDPAVADAMIHCLSQRFGHNHVQHCHSIAQVMAQDLMTVDLVISAMDLSDGSAMDLMREVFAQRIEMPVVIVGNQHDANAAMALIRAGAADYVVKTGDFLTVVPLVVEKSLTIWRTRQENISLHAQLSCTLTALRSKNRELESVVKKLRTMAATDPLTGLANRRAFNLALQRSFSEAMRYGHDLACIMIDLDWFKMCNDMLGHLKGDEVLQRAARVLEGNCRRSDVPARFGGDEFAVLLPQTAMDRARRVAQRIADEMSFCSSGWWNVPGVPCPLSMSMGLATLHQSKPTIAEELLTQADRALYAAKSAGRSQLMVDEPQASAGYQQFALAAAS